MKGKFTYDNKTFRWKFKIEMVFGLIRTYAEYTSKILYRNKVILSAPIESFHKSYKDTILEYNSKSYKEIKMEVEEGIIKDYEKRKRDKEFKKIEMKFK